MIPPRRRATTFIGAGADPGFSPALAFLDASGGASLSLFFERNDHPDKGDVRQRLRANNHSAIALAELLSACSRLDPADPRTASVLASYDKLMAGIPAHRLAGPSVAVIAEAGILAGTLARLRSLPQSGRQAMLNDAIIYLQGLEQGLTVLTRNIGDFDMLQQLVPGGRVLFYRQQP